jgi:3-hydroxyisobutyrate dehydrogenase-like beta-hydroxyacid dehydrogenase
VTDAIQRIAFLGVGLMGHGMARNLLAKGFTVSVVAHRNRAPVESLIAKGATEAGSPEEALRDADAAILCVTGTPQVEELVYRADGVLAAARRGLVVIDCSTSEPDSTARIAADIGAKGAAFADAPLARTPKEAEEGRLNVMVGADEAVLARILPVLQAFAENIAHMGPVGAGHKTKLVYNFLTMGMAALIAEALAAGAKVGLDLERFAKVVSAGGANSGIFQMIAPKALAGDYGGLQFSLANARKDVRYFTRMIEAAGMPGFLGAAVLQSFVQAAALGFGDRLVGSLIEAQERINGIKVGRR